LVIAAGPPLLAAVAILPISTASKVSGNALKPRFTKGAHAMPTLMTIAKARLVKFDGDSRTTSWRLEKSDPRFPKRVRLGRREYLVVEEIDSYIAARIAERDAEEAIKDVGLTSESDATNHIEE
jgi:predicted DNA-binding transcriptional regulator AlpA